MALALDGKAHNNTSGASTPVTLTTTSANDVIIVCVTTNGGPVTGINDTAGLVWNHRAQVLSTSGAGQYIELWYAVAASALSSDVITVTPTSAAFTTVDAFGISGANTSSPFDPNGALPGTENTVLVTATITTTNANNFLIGTYRFGSQGNPTQGTPNWILISGADFQLVEYQIVSATQSALAATIGTGNNDQNAGIADAVTLASVGGGSGPIRFLFHSAAILAANPKITRRVIGGKW